MNKKVVAHLRSTGRNAVDDLAEKTTEEIKRRLEHLRVKLRAERISYSELHELQSLAGHIDPGDVELLEAAGVPESVEEKTLAVFRVWKEDGEVLALFPEYASTDLLCTCYAHQGQHSSADYAACISNSRPAKPHEYKALAAELKQRGYNLKIVSRWQRARHKRRG